MRALYRPILQPRDPQRAAIAHPLGDHLPGIAEVIAILPDDPRHVAKVRRLHLPDAKRHPGAPIAAVINVVGGHRVRSKRDSAGSQAEPGAAPALKRSHLDQTEINAASTWNHV